MFSLLQKPNFAQKAFTYTFSLFARVRRFFTHGYGNHDEIASLQASCLKLPRFLGKDLDAGARIEKPSESGESQEPGCICGSLGSRSLLVPAVIQVSEARPWDARHSAFALSLASEFGLRVESGQGKRGAKGREDGHCDADFTGNLSDHFL